ncbi:YihY/virulence factor BrkB family protein [Luteolibacter flavescens]|uniref:YihY/virulence factor BrkB family protein n=1 Tax=Luteolibacter flavescens TaxID=1859460 RepID=A0ABT3FJ22_9BACT|nr:YihY/virulence factor BrkB family protein [Luteolibacter flavescens]MCW1883572.1 YihY/virulence factor BrkB family protein [Luteolibacter flavescens]
MEKEPLPESASIFALLKETAEGFIEDEGLRLSAALAYYSAFALAPLLLIVLSIAGLVFGDDAVSGMLYDEIRRDLGHSGAAVLEDMVAHARDPQQGVVMSLVGLVVLLFGAAGLFGQLQSALNAMWNVPPRKGHGVRNFVKSRFLSFSMVLGTGFLLLVSMVVSTMLHAVGSKVGQIANVPAPIWAAVGGVISFALIALLFAAIFKVLPDVVIRWRDVWTGAIFTSGLFAVGKSLIGWYLGREAMASSYGSAGSLIVVLSWLYYSSAILLFGAEFTQVQARAAGREIKARAMRAIASGHGKPGP